MALANQSDVPERASSFAMDHEYGVSANVNIFKGALVALSAGFIEPGTGALALVSVGRAEENCDNTGGADGALACRVRSGIYRYQNSAGDAVPATQVGAVCFIEDDEFVASTDNGGTLSEAGVVYEVDANGVWVAQAYPTDKP